MTPDTRTAATLGYALALHQEWCLQPYKNPHEYMWVWRHGFAGGPTPYPQACAEDFIASLNEEWRTRQYDYGD